MIRMIFLLKHYIQKWSNIAKNLPAKGPPHRGHWNPCNDISLSSPALGPSLQKDHWASSSLQNDKMMLTTCSTQKKNNPATSVPLGANAHPRYRSIWWHSLTLSLAGTRCLANGCLSAWFLSVLFEFFVNASYFGLRGSLCGGCGWRLGSGSSLRRPWRIALGTGLVFLSLLQNLNHKEGPSQPSQQSICRNPMGTTEKKIHKKNQKNENYQDDFPC